MTTAEARAHAEQLIAHETAVNISYVADPGLQKHAITAAIVLDLANQLEAALDEVANVKASHMRPVFLSEPTR